ncbi:terpenoid synthase [Epithele typhae]|uniref:terpenoid synthase n=1 Tax=Epithele typhae TaxID=378194 RepID=UPI002007DAC5|nr:terpenoid synthase [Epithele typhae]KAH9945295.1 terpenoid synthase [Epithele typhae]
MAPTQFTLPNLYAMCPLEGSTSEHYEKAAAESRAWVNNYHLFKGAKLAFFLQGNNELLVSHTYPYAPFAQFRTCCDFVNLLFVVDEVSDEQDGIGARATGEVYLNAMRHPDWNDGSVLAKMTLEFKQRLLEHAGPNSYRRFLVHCADYINAVAREAELREAGEVLSLADFEPLRRENSAIRLCFGLFETCLGIDLPDSVFQDRQFMTLYWAAADMVCWANDVYSYNMEQARGLAGNNIVTVLMREHAIDLQAASDRIGAHFGALMDTFVRTRAALRSFGSPALDAAVARYVEAMGHWIIGNLDWSFISARYFGAELPTVRATGVVTLSPRVRLDEDSDVSDDAEEEQEDASAVAREQIRA